MNVAHDGKLKTLHLFAGAGGGILADLLLGHVPVCACEIEEYPRKVLLQRQRDGILPEFPIWDDVRTFDGKPWRGRVDCVSGGFPCQDVSIAGKGVGISGERSGLWKEYSRIVNETRPRFIFAENSPMLRTRGLSVILRDLSAMGYNVRWGVLGAWHVGATHKRDRMWILASDSNVCDAVGGKRPVFRRKDHHSEEWMSSEDEQERFGWLAKLEPENGFSRCGSYGGIVRALHGVADRVDRLKAVGNGQVPEVAAVAWEILTGELNV